MTFEHSDDVIRELLRVRILKQALKIFNEETESYFDIEHASEIECSISDEDMLLFRIDMALDVGDKESFMQLTNELRSGDYAHST